MYLLKYLVLRLVYLLQSFKFIFFFILCQGRSIHTDQFYAQTQSITAFLTKLHHCKNVPLNAW